MTNEVDTEETHKYPGKYKHLLGQPNKECFNQSYLDTAPYQIRNQPNYNRNVKLVNLRVCGIIVVIIVKPPVY